MGKCEFPFKLTGENFNSRKAAHSNFVSEGHVENISNIHVPSSRNMRGNMLYTRFYLKKETANATSSASIIFLAEDNVYQSQPLNAANSTISYNMILQLELCI